MCQRVLIHAMDAGPVADMTGRGEAALAEVIIVAPGGGMVGDVRWREADRLAPSVPHTIRQPSSRHPDTAMLESHARYDYSPITERPDYVWPGGRRLAVYIAVNIEAFRYGRGKGAAIAPPRSGHEPQHLLVARLWESGRDLAAARALRHTRSAD